MADGLASHYCFDAMANAHYDQLVIINLMAEVLFRNATINSNIFYSAKIIINFL